MFKLKRVVALGLATTMLCAAALSGCSKKEDKPLEFTEGTTKASDSADSTKANTNENEKPTDEGNGILREATINKIGSLNPLTYIQSYSSTQIKRSSLLLYTYFPNEDFTFTTLKGELAAEDPIKMDEEGKVWHLKLREGVVWQNGDTLNADDVLYTWKMMLDPKLANLRASNFAKDVIEINNAMKYFKGEATWEEVGLKKIDDLTVEITTANGHDKREVMTHLAHPANCVINEEYYEKFMNADRTETLYGTSADKWISAGPFLVDTWINDAEITFKKNPDYIFKDLIWLGGISIKVVADSSTQMQLFENGETDYIELSATNYLKYEEDPRVLLAPYNSVTHLVINTANPDQPILANEKFRQALYYAVDRQGMASLTKQNPADYIVPTTHIIDLDKGVTFRETDEAKANLHENFSYDPEKAKQLFDEALAEVGQSKITLNLIYSDSELQTSMSEYLQQSISKVFGADKFELKLQAMPGNQRSDFIKTWKTSPAVYDISWGGWSSTDLMPWNAFKYWTTYYSAKNEPYLSEEFDKVFDEANFGADRFQDGKRLELVAEMENMLLEPAVVIPITQNFYKYLKSDRLQLSMKNWANRVEYGWDYAKIVE